ncbi:MAG TPA: D-amino-acid transaminase [Caulobacteraceae bacterium]|jgi:D-alanine transaminase
MSRVSYVNGRFVPHAEASVHVEDRGLQLADGVYEVWAVLDGRLADSDGHFERLERSLDELRIRRPMTRTSLLAVLREAVRRNRVRNGIVYLQVTRGTARRDHAFPAADTPPTVVITARTIPLEILDARARAGVAVIAVPETRWARCDIKTVGLLPNALAKQAAKEAGAFEAWFVDELGFVTEGASTNAWIVDADGLLRTRDTNANILRGVTRKTLIDLARSAGLEVAERPFTVDEAKAAREAFLTSASTFVTPIVRIDGAVVADGQPGPVTRRLRGLYLEQARNALL